MSPYKLCDFKPLYGLIFEDYLGEYDFWGHCDVDLVFGDIRHFITEDILNRYDRILSRGHFSLYRNNKETNLTFLLSKGNTVGIPSYEEVFSSERSFSFDEWPGLSRIWRSEKNDRMWDEIVFDDIAVLCGNFVSCQKQKTEKGVVSNVIFEYDGGHLFRHYLYNRMPMKEETMYVHFQKRNLEVRTVNKNRFLIIPNAFVNHNDISLSILKQYGRKRLFLHHHLFYEGIGLRQLMDYYYVLKDANRKGADTVKVKSAVTSLGLSRFSAALMWVLSETFGLDEEKMLWIPNERDGAFLLREIMRYGNFGLSDKKQQGINNNKWKSFWLIQFKTFRYWRFEHWAWFWSPIYRIKGFVWRKYNGYK